MHIRWPSGKHFDEKYVVATIKHPLSQMISGATSCCGAAGLYLILPNTTMNNTALPQLHDLPCHRSKVVTDFLKKDKISVLEWPENIPDINPVVMKYKVAYRQPSSTENLR